MSEKDKEIPLKDDQDTKEGNNGKTVIDFNLRSGRNIYESLHQHTELHRRINDIRNRSVALIDRVPSLRERVATEIEVAEEMSDEDLIAYIHGCTDINILEDAPFYYAVIEVVNRRYEHYARIAEENKNNETIT